MIICGDFSLSPDECQAQMTMWSIWSAPLYLSNDLRNIRSDYRELILNREVIAIDQDPRGFSGIRVVDNSASSVWKKYLMNGDLAVAFLNFDTGGTPSVISVNWQQLNITGSWRVRDLWAQKELNGTFSNSFNSYVNCHSATLYRFRPVSGKPEITQQ